MEPENACSLTELRDDDGFVKIQTDPLPSAVRASGTLFIHDKVLGDMPFVYRNDLRPDAAAIARLYDSAGLIRPTKDVDRIRRMYEGSNVVWTAWDVSLNGAEAQSGASVQRAARRGAEQSSAEQGSVEQSSVEPSSAETGGMDGARLAGILRGWTDGAYDGYVCDLAVAAGYQKQGIGRELLARVAAHYGREVQWVLRAAPIAAKYYEHLGWKFIENGWSLAREEWRTSLPATPG
jgi:ribosomal protein S18 acetylase RimI-like enzyme